MTKTFRMTGIGFLVVSLAMGAPQAFAAPVTVAVGSVEGAPGKDVVVPISFKGAKDAKGVFGMQVRLSFDQSLLKFKSADKGPAMPNGLVQASADPETDPGLLGVVFMCGSKSADSKEFASVDTDGVVVQLTFTVSDKAASGQKCALKLDKNRLIDNAEPPVELLSQTEDGEFKVGGGLPLLWILIGAGVLLLLIIILLATRRKDDKKQQWTGATPAAGGFVPQFTPESPTFSYKCVKCGGVLQLPRAMAGQTFQCGACGTQQVAKP